MALKTSVVDGDQLVTSHKTETRVFLTAVRGITSDSELIMRNTETIETKSEVWYTLTYAAAEAERSANVQPEDEDEKYSYSISRDQKVIGSYTLTRNYTKVTIESELESEPTSDVTFSPVTGTYPVDDGETPPLDTPLDVTLSCTDDDAWIFYEITGAGAVPPNPTTGSDHVPANTAISVQLVAGEVTTIKAFALVLGSLVSGIESITYTGEVV